MKLGSLNGTHNAASCKPDKEDQMTDCPEDLIKENEALKSQLAQYEAWMRAIDEYANFDFWFKDADSTYKFVNAHFAKNMGRDKCQLQDKSAEDIFDGDRLDRVRTLDKQIMADGYLKRVIPCNASGKLEMHEEHRFAVTDERGKPIGLGCFAFEVTEKSLAEETLDQAEKLASLCSWRWSSELNALISCSAQTGAFLGVPLIDVFEVFPKRASKLVLPEDRHLLKPVEDLISGRSSDGYEIEYRLRRPDGEIIFVREIAEPFNDGGKVTEYLGVMQDITREKKAEAALKQANETLEKKVQERTAELRAAKNSAELASRVKSQFLTTLSHEIRTPLNGVMGLTQLLARTDMDAQQTQFIKLMELSGKNLMDVLNSILDFSRIETGRLELSESGFDLRRLMDETIELLAPLAAQKGLDLRFNFPKDLPTHFMGDRLKIRQIAINLIGNAIKFTEKGYVEVEIFGDLAEDKMRLNLAVKDTGIGIANSDLLRIFEQFEQSDTGYRRSYDGTGLGLSIAKSLAEMMDGNIAVESTLNVGSRFVFTCDLKIVADTDMEPIPLVPIIENKALKKAAAEYSHAATRPAPRLQAGGDDIAANAGC